MKKGIGPYGLGAPKAVGKQITKDKIIKGAKEAGKFISNPGAYVTGKIITQIAGSKGAGANPELRLPTMIEIGGIEKGGKEALQENLQTKKPSKSITDIKRLGKVMEGGMMMKQTKHLKRKPVKQVNKPKTGGLQKLSTAKPKSDAQLQKITPAKPKPKLVKPKKVKIKVKPNKTKIKIKK